MDLTLAFDSVLLVKGVFSFIDKIIYSFHKSYDRAMHIYTHHLRLTVIELMMALHFQCIHYGFIAEKQIKHKGFIQ